MERRQGHLEAVTGAVQGTVMAIFFTNDTSAATG